MLKIFHMEHVDKEKQAKLEIELVTKLSRYKSDLTKRLKIIETLLKEKETALGGKIQG